MDRLIAFSRYYANEITAFAACGALILAAITLWYLKLGRAESVAPSAE